MITGYPSPSLTFLSSLLCFISLVTSIKAQLINQSIKPPKRLANTATPFRAGFALPCAFFLSSLSLSPTPTHFHLESESTLYGKKQTNKKAVAKDRGAGTKKCAEYVDAGEVQGEWGLGAYNAKWMGSPMRI